MATDYGLRYNLGGGQKSWCIRLDDGTWLPDSEGGARDYLLLKGLSAKVPKTREYSDIDVIIGQAKQEWHVHAAGAFAGYLKADTYQVGIDRVLITRNIPLVQPVLGNCDLTKEFLSLAFPKPDQVEAFHGWMQNAQNALRNGTPGDWKPGQCLVMIGDSGIGKTALQKLITNMFTGRGTDPALYMTDRTAFNTQMGVSEHWCLSDPRGKNSKDRSFLGELKKSVADSDLPWHSKGKDLITIPTFRRLTVSLNPDNEALQILQGMADSDLDKLIILDFEEPGVLRPDHKNGFKYPEWKKHLTAEIPAYLEWVINTFQVPTHMFHDRYGIVFHNPDVEPAIAAASADNRDEALAEVIYGGLTHEYTGNLTDISPGNIHDQIFHWKSPVKERAKTYPELAEPHLIEKLMTRFWNKYDGKMKGYHFTRFSQNGKGDRYTVTIHTKQKGMPRYARP